jgi:hypothetical protein
MDTPTTAGFNIYNTMRSAVWYGFRQESGALPCPWAAA